MLPQLGGDENLKEREHTAKDDIEKGDKVDGKVSEPVEEEETNGAPSHDHCAAGQVSRDRHGVLPVPPAQLFAGNQPPDQHVVLEALFKKDEHEETEVGEGEEDQEAERGDHQRLVSVRVQALAQVQARRFLLGHAWK